GGSAGSKQIVHNQDTLSVFDCILVNLEGVASILEAVFNPGGRGRKLSRFAHGNEPRIEAIRQRWSKDETTGFHAENQIHLLADVVFREKIDELRKSSFVPQ